MSSKMWKTHIEHFYLLEGTTHQIKYLASFLNSTFLLSFTSNITIAINHVFIFYLTFEFIKALLQFSCILVAH